jgi:uncharacterized protein (UPF0548 family)
MECKARIGHGQARFTYAWTTTLTWGIQRNSGFRIEHTEMPPEASVLTYVPVTFDENGAPIASSIASPSGEVSYGPNGEPFLSPGETVNLLIPLWLFRVKAPARVVYVIDEPDRKGFAYGTLPGHPECGEELFLVERKEDDSVWITIRSFSRPASWAWWLVYPVLRASQAFYTRRYLKALSGPID